MEMEEDLAIKIFEQLNLCDVGVGACMDCPIKKKDISCDDCLCEVKQTILNKISRDDELIKILKKHYFEKVE